MEFDDKIVSRIRQVAGNSSCADCEERDPEWASINLGVVVCVRCSGAHRSLGTHISQVRSLKLDNWTEEQVLKMESLGNDEVNSRYEKYVPKHVPRPAEFPESDVVRRRYIKLKYEDKAFEMMRDDDEERQSLCQKEGYLLKQSKSDLMKWQKRWLVLSEGALAYYKTSDSQTPNGVIRIGSAAVIGLASQTELTISSGPGHREFRFRASTSDELFDWLQVIRASRSADGRGSLVRRALGGCTLDVDELDDRMDESPPGSIELCREALKVLSDGHSLKHGWLYKRSSGAVMSKWTKRYFVLIPEGAIYYFKSSFTTAPKKPMGAMSVVGASVECETQKSFAIAIRCPEGQMLLAADNEEERSLWISALKSAADAHNSPAN